ncbi:TraI domain-containing protein [Serratia marcescens]|nr:TraI domain-containing protein [Serratia marcescens]MBH2865976.1 TraI domain-containing protein [Serratia marcescens]MBW4238502.1 TraI domain-containing protein [Enterobacter roggenkampii]
MLNKIKTLLSCTPAVTEPFGKLPVLVPTGYFSPVMAEELTISALRQDALQKIRENNALSGEVYQRLYLAPAHHLLERTQNVPAAPDGRWAYAGGFGDLSLRFTAYAVRLARGYMFPPGAAPEEQAAQGVIWQAVIFWAALCYHLPLLASIEGETTSGANWQPGISVPDAPYRFRFRPSIPNAHDASALAALAAGQLMPAEAINWLSGTSAALFSLAGAFRNGSPDMPLIRTLLDQAAEKVDSPVLRKETGESSVAIGKTVPDEPAEMEEVPRYSDTDADRLLPATQVEPGHPVNVGADAQRWGEAFLAWLSDSMVSGRITINQHDSRVHSVAGFIYLLVPDIFFLFLKDTGSDSHREQIQTSFEKLQIHRIRKGERFTRAKLYCSEDKQGRFSRVNGYLIKAARLKGVRSPEDSKLLFFP